MPHGSGTGVEAGFAVAPRKPREGIPGAPPREWIEDRLDGMQELLERRTEQSALLLRELLGQVRLEPTLGDIGRPYYGVRTTIDCLVLLKTPPGRGPDGGSSMLQQWTRTQRIRTAVALPFEVALVDTLDPPTYQLIAAKALHLHELGLSDRAIARRLGVTDKTAAKGIGWILDTEITTGRHP
ncbi:MAG: hypothetical protein WEG36_14215 [Gemmatimonadota bacterium]